MNQIKAICSDCGGTGLYNGFCEKEGFPVICLTCGGTGCEIIYYKPFIKRRIIKGVKGVQVSQGRFIGFHKGENKNKILSYKEFLKLVEEQK